MGISSETRLIAKEEDNVIGIYPLETENNNSTQSFSVDYLLSNIVSKEVNGVNFDISKLNTLELSMCNLTDLPLACKNLNLKHLGLSHNKLQQVPLCLFNGMKYLESLDLSHNNITNFDIEPECILYVKKMKLNNNKFNNVPKWFLTFRCTNMEEFNYSNNKAKCYKFMKSSFNLNLMKLKKLELTNSCLIDQDFSLLKCFKGLVYLDISSSDSPHINRFDDLDELFVKPKWKELNFLKLNGLSLSIFPEGIAWIESLKELYVSNNSLSWLPDGIEFMVNLEVLDVSSNDLVSLPQRFVILENLKVLIAHTNSIDCVPDFSPMSNLKTLDFFDNSLSTILYDIKTVDYIDLEYNYCDTSQLQNFSCYEEKKLKLRERYSLNERYDGPKICNDVDLLESYSDKTSDSESLINAEALALISSDEDDENWDLPVKATKMNSDIDSEDEKWQGEEIKPRVKKNSESRVYLSDDDWMFVDFDES